MQAWDVIKGNKVIDTVWFDTDCNSDYVRRSLIEHDGYSPNIIVCVASRMQRR